VLVPATFRHLAIPRQTRQRARALLAEVDIEPRPGPIATLSRGEMQRVAIARALLFSPPLIAADEPTASLDLEAGRAVTGLLRRLAREAGSTLLVVSHDSELLGRLDRVYSLMGGRLVPVRAAAAS